MMSICTKISQMSSCTLRLWRTDSFQRWMRRNRKDLHHRKLLGTTLIQKCTGIQVLCSYFVHTLYILEHLCTYIVHTVYIQEHFCSYIVHTLYIQEHFCSYTVHILYRLRAKHGPAPVREWPSGVWPALNYLRNCGL